MSEIVKNEMDAIAAFAENTEKRRSTLTLNELNYISDKQLHKKDGGTVGLPVASASNEGQALVSTKKYVKGAVIVPEQTVTTDNEDGAASLSGVITPSIGDLVIVTVNDTEEITTVFEEENNLWVVFGDEVSIDCTDSKLWGDIETTYTVSVYAAEPAYSWEPDPYVGYDIVVKCNNRTNNLSDYEVLKYDADKVISKIRNYEFVNGILFYVFNYDDLIEGGTNTVVANCMNVGMYHDYGRIEFNRTTSRLHDASILIYSEIFKFNTDADGFIEEVTYESRSRVMS